MIGKGNGSVRRYLTQRLLLAVPTIFLATVLVFLLTRVMPGDPAVFLAGTDATRSDIVAVRQEFHLNDPVVVQYLRWVEDLAHGNLGRSVRNARLPVTTVLKQRMQATFELGLITLLISIMISVPLGVLSAYKRDTLWDHGSTTLALLALSFPSFVLAYLLIFVVGLHFKLLPPAGYASLTSDPLNNLRYMALPSITLASGALASQTRLLRTSVLEVLSQEYVTVARAKGLSTLTVLRMHVLKNALIPYITIVGIQVGSILGGAVIVETIFGIPGMGKLTLDAIQSRDFPTIQGVVLVIVVVYLVVNTLIDVMYAYLDPRIRLGG